MSSLFIDSGPAATGQKVMLATTVYDSPDASYTFSIQSSRMALAEAGIQSAYLLLSGNCHVDDARNSVLRSFLKSDCTDLVFIDADVSWKADDLVLLCRYDRDIVGGVYPYRRAGSGGMPVRCIRRDHPVDGDGLLEVEGLPTGFLRIRRGVIETLVADAPTFRPKDEDGAIPLVFERTLINGQRWGGDVNFCRKWRERGGKLYASPEMRLGHVGKHIITDSLGAALRRQNGTTLSYATDLIRRGEEQVSHLIEAQEAYANPWAAEADVLAFAINLARKATRPVIEAGSGLTTLLMAAATDQTVYCLEHDPYYASRIEGHASELGLTNIQVVPATLANGWYRHTFDLPDRFSFGLNDGPPRQSGDRMGFFAALSSRCEAVLCDDADDPVYAEKLAQWADKSGWRANIREGRAMLLYRPEIMRDAA